MPSATPWRSRASALVAALGVLAVTSVSAAGEPPPTAPVTTPPPPEVTLAEVLAAFRAAPGLEAHFTESRHLALLAAPLETEGMLYYTPPGLLSRHTTRPTPSWIVIEPHRVRFNDGASWTAIDLDAKPVVRLLVESFVTLLAGDNDALSRAFTVDFSPRAPRGWRLVLRPRAPKLAKIIARMEVEGDRAVVQTMRVVEVGGDETITTFSAVDPERTYTPEERDRLFFLSPR